MHHELTKLGLLETEAKIYIASLSLGPATAQQIAHQAQVKRSTTYFALEHLMKYGLVVEHYKTNRRLFRAEDPDKLTKFTKQMRREVISAELQLDEVLPELKSLQKKIIEAPHVSFYQGMSGVRNIIEEVSSYRDSWYFFGSSQEIIKKIPVAIFEELMRETTELRIKAGRPKCYFITDEGIKHIKQFQKKLPQVREIRVLPYTITSKSALFVFGSKFAVINMSDTPFGVIIDGEEVADVVRLMYSMIWSGI